MPQLLDTKLWVVVLLLSACATEVKGKQVSRSEAAAGARAAESGKAASRQQQVPVCVDGEMSVPHSANDPCVQDDSTCLEAGGAAFASCEGGNWANVCFCIVPPQGGWRAACGNGLIEKPVEECDKTELDQASCVSLGFRGGGVLRCDQTTCLYDTQACKS